VGPLSLIRVSAIWVFHHIAIKIVINSFDTEQALHAKKRGKTAKKARKSRRSQAIVPPMMQSNNHIEKQPVEIIHWHRGMPLRQGEKIIAVIGNFDGVHCGHHHLLSQAKMLADDLGYKLAVLTFSPHPRSFFRPQDPPFLLMDEQQKERALTEAGANIIIHIQFDDALRMASPDEFIQEVLRPLHIAHLFAGADFAFGKARAGDVQSLAEAGQDFDMQITAVSLHHDDHHMTISSTRIRAALQAGQVDLATKMLGRPHMIAGTVSQGDQRGRTIGFPTANLALTDQLHPAFGVYAITATIDGHDEALTGVANIGQRPTVNDRGVLAEAHLFDFASDIYGKRLEIALQGYVRAEQKFSGLDELKAQIAQDCQTAKTMLAQKHDK